MRFVMKIWKLMTRDVFTCGIHDNLNTAAQLMWDHDIGALPVLDDHARIVGVITDRDICMAAYTRGEPLRAIAVATTMSMHPATCFEDDELSDVEALMSKHQIHRVPVVDDDGRMVGIVSINDVARAAHSRTEVSPAELAATVAAVSAPRQVIAEAA
jgi:CBS domain-containing protein